MKTKILIVGFASLSLFAAAQSQSNEKKQESKATTEVKSPRDHASGQASGRRMHQKAEDEATAAREASTGKATGKTMAQDDWHQQNAVSTDNSANAKSVPAADVDADGKADRTKSSGYDVKKQTSARVATGDANGDGADAAASSNSGSSQGAAATAGQSDVKSPRDSSTGMATGKRQHGDIHIHKASDKAPQK